jgi:hypothetical protein
MGRDAGEEPAQLFERIGVQAVEMWVHGEVFFLAKAVRERQL